jgi:hypothetical protein
MANENSIYGHEIIESDGLSYGYTVDLVTRKIRFQYDVSHECSFNFSLLAEVGENWQIPFKQLLAEDGIELGIYDGKDDYCNIVLPGSFLDSVWE